MRLSLLFALGWLATQSVFAELDYKQLAATKRDHPPKVATTDGVKYSIPFGEAEIPKGSTVNVLAISPDGTLSIEFNGQQHSIPATKTDLEKRVAEIRSRRILIDGVEYEDFSFYDQTDHDVRMEHRNGRKRVQLSKLPPEWQKKLGYDAERVKAEATKAQAEAEQAGRDAAIAKAKAKAEAMARVEAKRREAEAARIAARGDKRNTVEGERSFSIDVFIRTRGGENIKCGLVTVNVYDEKSMLSWHPAITEKLYGMAFDWNALAIPSQEKLTAARKAFLLAYPNYWTNLLRAGHSKEFQALTNAVDESNSIIELGPSLPEIFADAVVQSLPRPVTSVKTDADGRCTGKVPKAGTYAFCGRFSRLVMGKERDEVSTWLVWVDLYDLAPKKIMLSNDNVIETLSPENVLQVYPKVTTQTVQENH